MRRIERVFNFTTPEQSDREDLAMYRAMSPDERVRMLMEMMNAWHGTAFRRLERTYRFVHVDRS
ncbi:hypothetical protein OP10G_1248 [Fimbriimonas ginsengisoli Gsoil 348]|uniref:Uncharacterized protein n=1 Tax=Fimbriimonas ginsengisoli Gsoil 348 TaxID=661478 RepID=A0A068NMD8_FIMGI|nr:hypothetical protein OP10G_1248 [Fimbriimonas ginsengisoli Gsoil 348]